MKIVVPESSEVINGCYVIMHVINHPLLFPGIDSATGLRDIDPTIFLSPARKAAHSLGVSGGQVRDAWIARSAQRLDQTHSYSGQSGSCQ